MRVYPKSAAGIIGLLCILPALGCNRTEQCQGAPISARLPFDVQLKTDLDKWHAELATLRQQKDSSNPERIKRIAELEEQLPPQDLENAARQIKEGQTENEVVNILGKNFQGHPETLEMEWRSGNEGVSARFYHDKLVEWSPKEYREDGTFIRGHSTIVPGEIEKREIDYQGDPSIRQRAFGHLPQNSLSSKLRIGMSAAEAKQALGLPDDTSVNLRTIVWDFGEYYDNIEIAFRDEKACGLELLWHISGDPACRTLNWGDRFYQVGK